jgi:UDP-N-acetylmuramate--alanine ligase
VGDDTGAAALATYARDRGLEVITVGEDASSDLRLVDVAFEGSSSRGRVLRDGAVVGDLVLRIPGRHYLLDALAALAVGLRLGQDADGLLGGLAGFTGTGRRMELKGEAAGVRVYDSYAHHPVEIAGDLQAARAVVGDGRLVVAFQPHLVSRTRIFGEQMGRALGAADEVVVLDVYLAREDPDASVTGALVADAVPLAEERVVFERDIEAVPAALAARARPGDLVLTLGAGNVTELGPRVLDLLRDGRG